MGGALAGPTTRRERENAPCSGVVAQRGQRSNLGMKRSCVRYVAPWEGWLAGRTLTCFPWGGAGGVHSDESAVGAAGESTEARAASQTALLGALRKRRRAEAAEECHATGVHPAPPHAASAPTPNAANRVRPLPFALALVCGYERVDLVAHQAHSNLALLSTLSPPRPSTHNPEKTQQKAHLCTPCLTDVARWRRVGAARGLAGVCRGYAPVRLVVHGRGAPASPAAASRCRDPRRCR